jgi:hypothetical protein
MLVRHNERQRRTDGRLGHVVQRYDTVFFVNLIHSTFLIWNPLSATSWLLHHCRLSFLHEVAIACDRAQGVCPYQEAVVSGFVEDFAESGTEQAYESGDRVTSTPPSQNRARRGPRVIARDRVIGKPDLTAETRRRGERSGDQVIMDQVIGETTILRVFSVPPCLRGENLAVFFSASPRLGGEIFLQITRSLHSSSA